jgi:hypothetical protein
MKSKDVGLGLVIAALAIGGAVAFGPSYHSLLASDELPGDERLLRKFETYGEEKMAIFLRAIDQCDLDMSRLQKLALDRYVSKHPEVYKIPDTLGAVIAISTSCGQIRRQMKEGNIVIGAGIKHGQ